MCGIAGVIHRDGTADIGSEITAKDVQIDDGSVGGRLQAKMTPLEAILEAYLKFDVTIPFTDVTLYEDEWRSRIFSWTSSSFHSHFHLN